MSNGILNYSLIGEEFYTLLEKLSEYVFMPNFQGERSLGSMLFYNISGIMESYVEENANSDLLFPKFETVSFEFPIKKDDNNQSDNVDVLMLNRGDKNSQLILLEFKMTNTISDNDIKQFEKYKNIKERIAAEEGRYLIQGLLELVRNTQGISKQKYKNLYESIKKDTVEEIKSVRECKIIYIVPEEYREGFPNKGKIQPDQFIVYEELPKNIKGDYLWSNVFFQILINISSRFKKKLKPLNNRIENTQFENNEIKRTIVKNLELNDIDLNGYTQIHISKSLKKPNFMLENAKGEYETYHFSGSRNRKVTEYNKEHLKEPIPIEDLIKCSID